VVQIALAVAIFLLATLGGSAGAADPSTGLNEAEARAASAAAEIASTQAELDAARTRLATASDRANPVVETVRTAQAKARDLRETLLDRQQQANARIAELEAIHEQEADDHEREVVYGIGFGLAGLLGVGIAIGWGWFRATPLVAALIRTDLVRALGLCLGGGLLLIVVGSVLSGAKGLPGAIGALLLGLGFVLPTALLLGRHSAEVQRGRAKPAWKRDRLPIWVSRSAAVLLLLLALSGLGSSIFAEDPAAFSVSPQLREDSAALERGPDARRLGEAAAAADTAQQKAAEPLARQRAARAAVRKAARELSGAKNRLASAEADQRRFARRLAVLVAREEREAAREAARAEREAEEVAEEEEFSSGCDPNYSGCVPVYPPDVDCAEVGETVTVLGSDPHGLDADGDLEGCE
jgi:type VI protein secretion system component VasF